MQLCYRKDLHALQAQHDKNEKSAKKGRVVFEAYRVNTVCGCFLGKMGCMLQDAAAELVTAVFIHETRELVLFHSTIGGCVNMGVCDTEFPNVELFKMPSVKFQMPNLLIH